MNKGCMMFGNKRQQNEDINSIDDLTEVLKEYLNIENIKELDISNLNKEGLLYSRFYENQKMNKYMLESFFQEENYKLDYKYDCERQSINEELEFLIFYKKNESLSYSVNETVDGKYIDTHQNGIKSDIVALKYKELFVELEITKDK